MLLGAKSAAVDWLVVGLGNPAREFGNAAALFPALL